MNTVFALLSTALLLTSTSTVFAASSTDLTVKGLITPSACTPGLSSNVIDYGKVSAKDLKPDAYTRLGDSLLQMTLTCDAPTLMALQGVDNRGDAYDSYNAYGLGLVSGKKLGGYTLAFSNAMNNGAAISVLESGDNGRTWKENYLGDTLPLSFLASFGDQSTGNWAPTPVQNVTSDLNVQAIISPTAGMDLSNEVPILGSATLQVRYL
ncbi:DUF1120 domain-containing protein [Pseudomonas sp. 1152_12]|uniref:DUF1120 domain-containing protein n=1 Tax=Pseudomonas sp. 1152_12 TaxID=2604455 RepID=UPI0040633ADE